MLALVFVSLFVLSYIQVAGTSTPVVNVALFCLCLVQECYRICLDVIVHLIRTLFWFCNGDIAMSKYGLVIWVLEMALELEVGNWVCMLAMAVKCAITIKYPSLSILTSLKCRMKIDISKLSRPSIWEPSSYTVWLPYYPFVREQLS